jgi:hypothetical protein
MIDRLPVSRSNNFVLGSTYSIAIIIIASVIVSAACAARRLRERRVSYGGLT